MGLYRVTLAYDGTDFSGWQVQPRRSGRESRTVQGVLQLALSRLSDGQRVGVFGAGRTDAGVHALGQVASFDLGREMTPSELLRALNGLLPEDVRVLEATRPPEGFHARRSAVSKLYRYVLDTGSVRLPTRRRTAGHVPFHLEENKVREAAAAYLGRQDFKSLASSGGSVKTSVRTILRSEVAFEAESLVYEVEADGFLRQMVRSLVGGLVAAGRGTLSVDDLRRALLARDRRCWPAPVEACGLTLVRVNYPPAEAVG
jgi:tRNA pseudouridine38-40 synthase